MGNRPKFRNEISQRGYLRGQFRGRRMDLDSFRRLSLLFSDLRRFGGCGKRVADGNFETREFYVEFELLWEAELGAAVWRAFLNYG